MYHRQRKNKQRIRTKFSAFMNAFRFYYCFYLSYRTFKSRPDSFRKDFFSGYTERFIYKFF